MANLVEISMRDSAAAGRKMHAGKGIDIIQAFYLANLGIKLATLKQTAEKIRKGDISFKEVSASPFLTGTAYALAIDGAKFGDSAESDKFGSVMHHYAVAKDAHSGITLHLELPQKMLSQEGIIATNLNGGVSLRYLGGKTWTVTFPNTQAYTHIKDYSPNGVFAAPDATSGIGKGPAKSEVDASAVINELDGSPGAGLALVTLATLRHRNDDRKVSLTTSLDGKFGIFATEGVKVEQARELLQNIDTRFFHKSTDTHAAEVYEGVQRMLKLIARG